MTRSTARPPTALTRVWVRSLIGFSVGVAVGLAPYLGVTGVPLFTPLLELIPSTARHTTIPLSAALMGLVAMWVQWYGADKLSDRWLNRSFVRATGSAVACLLLFMLVHTAVVVGVQLDGGSATMSFVVSTARVAACDCPPDVPDSACIKMISMEESEIERCWGDRQVRAARLALLLTYLLTTTSVGCVAGLVVLRDASRARRRGNAAKARVAAQP